MPANKRKNTNKIRNGSEAAQRASYRGAPKPPRKAKAEPGTVKAESEKPVDSGKPKAESKKQKAVVKPDVGSPKSVQKDSIGEEENNSALDIPQSAINKSEITDLKSEIENMEVHHHPQLDHKPKPFKEYLLEGFMIFIAVMMGFIAENIRETINDNEHVRQLTSQLVQDLEADTLNLNGIYGQEKQILKDNDTLFALLQQPLVKADTKKMQKLAADSHSMWPFHPSAGAMGAIKNELHLKQFSDSKIIGYIARYEEHIELIHTVQDITLQYQRNFLDPFLCVHFTPANLDAAFNHSSVPNATMRNLTQEDLTQLGAEMVLIRINNNELLRDNRRLRNDALNLLRYVKKQYLFNGR